MDCSPPGSSVHRILQARILEWVAIPFSRGSSQPSDFEPESPALQANSLPLSYLGSPSLNLGLPQSSRLESASPNPVFRAVNDPITPHIIAWDLSINSDDFLQSQAQRSIPSCPFLPLKCVQSLLPSIPVASIHLIYWSQVIAISSRVSLQTWKPLKLVWEEFRCRWLTKCWKTWQRH